MRDHEPNGHGGIERSLDLPAPAVLAEGMWGVGRHQVWVEEATGFPGGAGERRQRFGPGHVYVDCTDAPMPTVIAGRPVNVMVVADPAVQEPTARPDRPPYRVPSMAEIALLRGAAGLKAVSTFSGCGGSCLGLEMAGFDVVWASEFVEAARDVYALNHPGVILDGRDIRQVKPEDILEATGLAVGELDLLEGSPPCASFSTAGKRHKGWGKDSTYSDTHQRTDDLFFEFARLLEGLQPRAFVAENVSGLVKGSAKGYFKMILRRLKECGYVVEAKLLDAQWLGVPQQRQRIIFQGVRADLGRVPAWPSPLPYRYSIRDALGAGVAGTWQRDAFGETERRSGPDAPAPTVNQNGIGVKAAGASGVIVEDLEPRVIHDTSGQYGAGDVTDRPSPTVTVGVNSVNSHHYQVEDGGAVEMDPETGYRITLEGHAIAPEWDKLAAGESSDRFFNLVRPNESAPSPTVTAANTRRGVAGVTHPVQRRKFTIAELRRICGFPDDFELTGTYPQRWERLGRAVPPPMMRAVGEAVRDGVLTPETSS